VEFIMSRQSGASMVRMAAAGVGVAATGYAAWAAANWLRYGHAAASTHAEGCDPLLDEFMPVYDVVERHGTRVNAPPAVALAAAKEQDLLESAVVRAIFRARELIVGAGSSDSPRPRGLLAQVQSLGWGVLADVPGREIVMGAVTKPWEANVTFRAVPPERFAQFDDPGYVKIAWTLRADPAGAGSVFRTETRAIATDAAARRKFRWYWSFFAPGIGLIRLISLGLLRRDAGRRMRSPGEAVVPNT
jgi:hypothetical protein